MQDSLQMLKDQHVVSGQVQQAQAANVSLY
jgi:hypothetical protein